VTQEASTELVPSFPECDRSSVRYSERCQRSVPKRKSATGHARRSRADELRLHH